MLALLFDLDGTLLDTFPLILEAQNGALAEHGEPPLAAEDLRPLIGMPLHRQMETLRGMTGPKVDAIHEAYYRRFADLIEGGVAVYPGVRETLAAVSGRRIGTMTTRRQKVADRMLEVAGLREHFHRVVGGDEVSRPKPASDLPLLAAKSLGRRPSDCVAVGDAPVDILAGRAAGMRTVAAMYGYGDERSLRQAKPDVELGAFEDLPGVLADLEARLRSGARRRFRTPGPA